MWIAAILRLMVLNYLRPTGTTRMRPTQDEAVRHLDDVVAHYESIYRERRSVSDAEQTELYVRLRAALTRLAPVDSDYAREANKIISNPESWCGLEGRTALCHCAISQSRLQESVCGRDLRRTCRADLFDDFLGMAEHLLSVGYKDPSAVIVGAVLEEHLRRLCFLHNIALVDRGKARKAESLNSDLASKAIYSKLDQKSITAWQDLRNNAAHGKFNAYTDDQVDLMLKGVRNFVSRYPA